MKPLIEAKVFCEFIVPVRYIDVEDHTISVDVTQIRAIEQWSTGEYPTCLLMVSGLNDQIEVRGTRKQILEEIAGLLNESVYF